MPSSLQLDLCAAADFAIEVAVALEQLLHVLRGAAAGPEADAGELVGDLALPERVVGSLVELAHQGRRQVARAEQGLPARDVEVGDAGLLQGRDSRIERIAPRRG